MAEDPYRIWEVLAAWVGAVGTVGAVIVALWLTFRSDKIKLRVDLIEGALASHHTGNVRGLIFFQVTNLTRRPAVIDHLSFRAGLFKKKALMIIPDPDDEDNHPLPAGLEDGMKAHWVFDNDDFNMLLGRLASRLRWGDRVLMPLTFRAAVKTTTGFEVTVRPDRFLRKTLRKRLKEVRP